MAPIGHGTEQRRKQTQPAGAVPQQKDEVAAVEEQDQPQLTRKQAGQNGQEIAIQDRKVEASASRKAQIRQHQ